MTTEWVATFLFTPKKDGWLRLFVNYRMLNAIRIRDSYPLPRIVECIESLGEETVFSELDAHSQYW